MTTQPAPIAATKTPQQVATTRFAYVGIVVPAVLTLLALAAQLRWFADAPNPLAVHWSGASPDNAGSPWVYVVSTLLLGFGLSGWLWATALPRMRRGASGWSFRFLASTALGMAAFGAVSMAGSVYMQRGLESWTEAPNILPLIVVALIIGVAAGFGGWFAQPKQVLELESTPGSPVALGRDERAVWVGTVRSSKKLVIGIVSLIALTLAFAFVAWLTGDFAVMWWLVFVAVILGVAAMATLEADVRVDTGGVEVRGPAGFPRSHTPLANIASASVVQVEAMGAFGGWGWRRIPGVQGVIMRSGEALRLERTHGPALVVTIDDAATAAGLIDALKARPDAGARFGVDKD